MLIIKIDNSYLKDFADSDEQVIYMNELQKLLSQNQERFHLLAQLMDKTHKAVAEENN